jgi:DNA-binding CsgD family transcriptional regulator
MTAARRPLASTDFTDRMPTMFNVKVFADFVAPPAATAQDRKFLDMLRRIRKSTGAQFVNFSAFDYGNNNPEIVHVLTYPMEWITHYVRNFYSGIDPLHTADFRRVCHVDWRDLYSHGEPAEMFRRFCRNGLGRNGISISVNVKAEQFCVLSLVFRTPDAEWPLQKQRNMQAYQFEADRASESYTEIYAEAARQHHRLTNRELQVLHHVALGRTDDQIATLMGIRKWTVVGHLQSVKYKLGCSNRTAAVAFAITSGLIDLKNAG